MKRFNFKILAGLGFFFFLISSCSAPREFTQVSYSNIERNNSQEKSENVYWFESSDSLGFQYEKIGVIGVTPGDEINQSEIETLVKLEAWKNYANGVLVMNSRGAEKSDSENKISQSRSSKKPQYNYLAIKFKEDSAFIAKYSERTDTSFVSKGIELQTKLHEPEPTGFENFLIQIGNFLLSFIITSLVMWLQLWLFYNPRF
jgi:hypothetical protein